MGRLPLLAVALVVAAICLVGDPRAASFSDAGGRLATVQAMLSDGSWTPDVGYWAGGVDPSGTNHPLLYTTRQGDAWVQAPSLPLVYLGRALGGRGGAAALLVFPVAGAVATVWAAGQISKWASGGDGRLASWLVALFTPVVFYAADFWEHAPATGLALAGMALLLSDRSGRCSWLGAGVLLGLAAVMRSEILVIGLALGLGLASVSEVRSVPSMRLGRLIGAVTVMVGTLLSHAVVEQLIYGGSFAGERVGSRASDAGLALSDRGTDALLTSIGLYAGTMPLQLLVGGLVVLGYTGLAWSLRTRHQDRPLVLASIVAVLAGFLVRSSSVLSAVPGFVTVTPLALVGLLCAKGPRERGLVRGVLLGILLVWLTQPVGQHTTQWGGRYLLPLTVVAVVVAAGQLNRVGLRSVAAVTMLCASAVVSMYGAVWHISRTGDISETRSDLWRMVGPDEVVVSGFTHLGRELGWWYEERSWLTAEPGADGLATAEGLEDAVATARRAGVDRLATVQIADGEDEVSELRGYELQEETSVPFLWTELVVRRYEADPGSGP